MRLRGTQGHLLLLLLLLLSRFSRVRPKSSPTRQVPSRGTPRVPAPLHLSPISPPDSDRRVDSPALSSERPSLTT